MQTVTVSPKFRVVIPRAVRELLNIRPGQMLKVLTYNGQLRLVPLRSLSELRGTYPGIGSELERDTDRI